MDHRVLVVDDHELWRRHISGVLEKTRGWQVAGEASDGPDAIQKVVALQPDLILLDLELPGMTGIDAARRIVAIAPESKILFMSAHRSLDIVEAAMTAGGRGYILKIDAGEELLPAMNAIVRGDRFIGAVLNGHVFDAEGPEASWSHRHAVGFYTEESRLLDAYAGFAKAALTRGALLMVAVVAERQRELDNRLLVDGVDVELAIGERRYRQLDVAAVLAEFMVNGWPDESRFWNASTALVLDAAKTSKHSHPRIAACGECAAILLREGNADAAVRLEELGDAAARSYKLDVFCGYSMAMCGLDTNSDVYQRISHAHPLVHP
jgi:DNA-binding NarL/FixJ family response regulator